MEQQAVDPPSERGFVVSTQGGRVNLGPTPATSRSAVSAGKRPCEPVACQVIGTTVPSSRASGIPTWTVTVLPSIGNDSIGLIRRRRSSPSRAPTAASGDSHSPWSATTRAHTSSAGTWTNAYARTSIEYPPRTNSCDIVPERPAPTRLAARSPEPHPLHRNRCWRRMSRRSPAEP
jgi:hypothetical protein